MGCCMGNEKNAEQFKNPPSEIKLENYTREEEETNLPPNLNEPKEAEIVEAERSIEIQHEVASIKSVDDDTNKFEEYSSRLEYNNSVTRVIFIILLLKSLREYIYIYIYYIFQQQKKN